MDVSFNNVLEGTRQYFMGLPKASPSQTAGAGQAVWQQPPEEGAPAQSGAPAPSSRPPSTAAAPPARPPDEPEEPEPHIIHKATVMREALEKRRERPDPDEEPDGAASPPSHIIRKPSPPAPGPRRPDSPGYRRAYRPTPPPVVRPPELFPGVPPEVSYPRYHYESAESGRAVLPTISPQPSRQSPQQTYARISSSMPQHTTAARLREMAAHSPPAQRYSAPPPPHNDRVPPIHHPALPSQRPVQPDSRTLYASHNRTATDPSLYGRPQYERHTVTSRKYDIQQAYPGYRTVQVPSKPVLSVEAQPSASPLAYKQAIEVAAASAPQYLRPADRARPPDVRRPEHASMVRVVDDAVSRNHVRSSYQYPTPSTSTARYSQSASVPQAQNPALPQRSIERSASYRPGPMPNPSYVATNHAVQTSAARAQAKANFANQQARMTVSVTTLVNQMNQTKQKRESPLDLSVKTVKNSADSSTTQEDADSSCMELKALPVQPRPLPGSRHPTAIGQGIPTSHKVDFAPDFHSQYRERNQSAHASAAPTNPPTRYNGSYEVRQNADAYPVESRHQPFIDNNKYAGARHEYTVPRIDLTRPTPNERLPESRVRDDRRYSHDDARKRVGGPIVNNIPEKIVRYETWSADSRIDRMSRSAREQQELMTRPVYSYSSHKRLEAFNNEQKRPATSTSYRDSRYPYLPEHPHRESAEYHNHYLDKHQSTNGRHIIQKIPSSKEIQPHPHLDHHNGVPANKRVLSILRNSLETKHTGLVEPARPTRHISELIVIDDTDDPPVIDITDLTKDNDPDNNNKSESNIIKHSNSTTSQKIQLPKAVDSIVNESDISKTDTNVENKGKSPENDVASRIRTKAELKVMPPQHEHSRLNLKHDNITENNDLTFGDKSKILPKSQKQHLFNQIREDNLRLESAIKIENDDIIQVSEIKTEPMNMDEIEKDATVTVKHEMIVDEEEETPLDDDQQHVDDDWANACDSFVEQLKTTTCHKKKPRRSTKSYEVESPNKATNNNNLQNEILTEPDNICQPSTSVVIKQEPVTAEDIKDPTEDDAIVLPFGDENFINKDHCDIISNNNNTETVIEPILPDQTIIKTEKIDLIPVASIKKEIVDSESTDDDEPLIKSKLLKEKEKSEQIKHQVLRDLSEKSAYVKLECCDVELTKNYKRDTDNSIKNKMKTPLKSKRKSTVSENKSSTKIVQTVSTDSDSDDPIIATRLRTRKSNKSEDNKPLSTMKTPTKSTPTKKQPSASSSSSSSQVPVRKQGFGDGSDFHPGWEEELYRFKRSLRMPPRLIAIPRGRSGGPFSNNSGALFTRGSTSLPDLDTVPLSPAPSSAPSAATDDIIARRPDKRILDSDLDSNSSGSAPNRQYDSEASTFTSALKKKRESIIDVLIQKCIKMKEIKKKTKEDIKNEAGSKRSPTAEATSKEKTAVANKTKDKFDELLPLDKIKKEPTSSGKVSEKSSRVKLKSKTRRENKTSEQSTSVNDAAESDRPSSPRRQDDNETEAETTKKDEELNKTKLKNKKIIKDKFKRRSSSIRDGLRSTSLKSSDAKGRLLRLKKRNKMMNSLASKKIKDFSVKKKETKSPSSEDKDVKEGTQSAAPTTDGNRKRFKRLFSRRKFSSGFDYIRKKKKIIRNDATRKIRRVAARPSPECEHDIHKEIKAWFINKSIGETTLHRAARLGYQDCVAYCLEKLNVDPSSRDNAGFTPLHVAAARGHVPIGKLLLKYGANVSAAAKGGIRPLHEACENSHVEMIRLLLSYGADPLLGTYSGQTPSELAEGPAAKLLDLHIADVQGVSEEPWRFHSSADIVDWDEIGCDPLSSPPAALSPPPDASIEIQCTEAPLPPFYSLRANPGQQPIDGLWCLLQDITSLLQIKSKENLLKQIHCGSGSPKELLRELRTQDFLERAQCHQFLSAGEKVNVRASKVALVRVTDKLRQLLKIETILVS